ncbi:MAG: hypothetical protein AAF298_18400 [Cyanobacteria bacterium P01_A01_bin.40]
MSKLPFTLVVFFVFSLLLIGCNSQQNKLLSINNITTEKSMELKIGGIYASKNEEGKYLITKILAFDDFAVHVRFYKEEFTEVPETILTENLTSLIGHAPMAREGFIKDQQTLIAVEKVSKQELEGYELYLDAMGDQ